MDICKNCNEKIGQGNVKGCPNCGATFCDKCAEKNQNICPDCYSTVEYIG